MYATVTACRRLGVYIALAPLSGASPRRTPIRADVAAPEAVSPLAKEEPLAPVALRSKLHGQTTKELFMRRLVCEIPRLAWVDLVVV